MESKQPPVKTSEENSPSTTKVEQSVDASKVTSKSWYTKWWGIIIAILFFPVFLIWYSWATSKWPIAVKVIVTVVMSIILLSAIGGGSSKQPAQPQASTPNASESVKVNFIFDVPSLIGKNIDQVRQVLGQPIDGKQIEPTAQQLEKGVTEWNNTWERGNVSLVITYNPTTRVITDYFVDTDDQSGVTKNKKRLLEEGNLSDNASNYRLEYVKAIKDPNSFTGVKIIPAQ